MFIEIFKQITNKSSHNSNVSKTFASTLIGKVIRFWDKLPSSNDNTHTRDSLISSPSMTDTHQ